MELDVVLVEAEKFEGKKRMEITVESEMREGAQVTTLTTPLPTYHQDGQKQLCGG